MISGTDQSSAADDGLSGRIAAMRRSYERAGLSEAELAADWLEQFQRWFADAEVAGLTEPNAMVLATASPEGCPSLRTVLCKGVDERGVVFHSNYSSRKGKELAANPRASLLFPWHSLQRQVIVVGAVRRLDPAESDAYFASRPRGSQLSALASPQSDVVDSRSELEAAADRVDRLHPEGTPVSRPPHWGGYLVVPESVEFWQGRRDRLHDRLRFRRVDGGWNVERLAP